MLKKKFRLSTFFFIIISLVISIVGNYFLRTVMPPQPSTVSLVPSESQKLRPAPATSATPKSKNAATKYTPKVLLVIYNPILENQGGKKVVDYKGWNNPDTLTQSLIRDIKIASNAEVSYLVVERVELDKYPRKPDGFAYTDETYLNCVQSGGKECHEPDITDYNEILIETQACEKRNSGEIDELWLFGGPWFGYYESNLAGPGAFWYNSPPTLETSCQKLLPIMGFNYERGEAEMFHDFGHRLESVMDQVYSRGSSNSADFFRRDSEGVGGCGMTHFPVNTTQEYNYADEKQVASTCADFKNYPDLTGKTEMVSCHTWGCSQLGYFKWMFSNLPRAVGATNGKLNNWWGYMVDTDNVAIY